MIIIVFTISLFGFAFFEFNFSIIHIDTVFSKTENKIVPLTNEQIKDEKRWADAKNTIGSFYSSLNLFHYEKARSYLTEGYAKENNNYSVEKLKEWQSRKAGKTKIINFQRAEGESKDTTKVFSYETRYDMKDIGKNCGEKLVAYVVLRKNEWSIDTIQRDSYVKCE